jgi:hypothetical protein
MGFTHIFLGNTANFSLFEKGKLNYKGHTVNALVLKGDEGRDKLR